MILATYLYEGKEKIGFVSIDKSTIIPAEIVIKNQSAKNMLEFIKKFSDDEIDQINNSVETEKGIPLNNVKLLAPIPVPQRGIICLGKNYREHVKEVKSLSEEIGDIPEYPIYFEKFVNKALANDETINLHSDITNALDYEAELAVIIGKEGRDIPADKAYDYIFGYTILNDVTARDIQKKHKQWFRGKSLDGTCPIGPWIIHKSLVPFEPKLNIECYINGEKRQSGNTGNMIFTIPYIISDFSKGLTLKPGDIISTGTPSGVGMGFNPPKMLKFGDKIECYIESIGWLRNTVK